MKNSMYTMLFLSTVLWAIGSCKNAAIESDYISEVKNSRTFKDSFYKANKKSPMGKDSTFEHLNYFPPSEDWIVECDFEIRSDTQIVIMDTRGYAREYMVYGTVKGKTPTGNIELFAFRVGQEPNLFIPFVDSTCRNNKSYKGGRFLECALPNENMKVTLDFNMAYNPYCHYNHEYNCPIVPKQNHLTNEILAGEKLYKEQKERTLFDH